MTKKNRDNLDFMSTIMEWASNTQIDVIETPAQIAKDILPKVILGSPVDSGRFVANWNVGSTPNITTSWTARTSKEAKIQQILSFITEDYFLRNKSVVLSNGLDYAHNVEYDGWKYTEAYAPVYQAYKYGYMKYGA